MQFNPQMFEQAKQFMTKDNLKFASEQIKNMSDEQLKQYAKMTGQNVDPTFLRNQANMFDNLSDSQVNQMKNMNYPQQQQNFNRNQQYIPPDNMHQPSFQSQSSFNASDQKQNQLYPNISSLKEKGNQFFKQQKYEEASSKYLDAILEIEEIKIKNPKKNCQDLRELEVACRSNYANTKAKLNDYETVLLQAIEILKISENGKAYFRLGQAYHKLGNNQKALPNLEKAIKLIPNDETIKELLFTVKENVQKQQQQKEQQQEKEVEQEQINLDEAKQNKKKHQKKQQEEEEVKQTIKIDKTKNQEKQQTEKEQKQYDSPQDDPLKNQENNNNNDDSNIYISPTDIPIKAQKNDVKQKQNTDSDVKIQDEEEVKTSTNTFNQQQQFQQQQQYNPYANMRNNLDPTQQQAAMDQLKNMDDNQMRQMCDMMKNMDPSFMKSMMESQTGVKMSDDDLKNMQNMFSPELLKMAGQMSGMQGQFPNAQQQTQNNNNLNSPTSQQSSSTSNNQQFVQQQGQQQQQQLNNNFGGANVSTQAATAPNFSTLLQNQEMITTLMDNLSKNPEMLKGMVKMLGSNHPLASMIDRASPKDLSRLVKLIKYGIKGIGLVAKIYKFIKKQYIPVMILIVAYIFYKYYF